MCNKVVSEDCFMVKYCFNRYKTQDMCDKILDVFLPTLTLFLNGWLRNKWLKPRWLFVFLILI